MIHETISSNLINVYLDLLGIGMARLSRLAQGSVLSVILDLLFLRFLLSILRILENTHAKPGMLWERL